MNKRKCEDNKLDIAVLNEKVQHTEEFVKEMKENHLPHIYDRLNDVDKSIARYAGGLAVLIILVQIISSII